MTFNFHNKVEQYWIDRELKDCDARLPLIRVIPHKEKELVTFFFVLFTTYLSDYSEESQSTFLHRPFNC